MRALTDVFHALADQTRRQMLDRLFAKDEQSLNELCARIAMSQQAVAKHLAILEKANLASVHWQRRTNLHYLNPVPLGDIVHRWVGKFEDARITALSDFKPQIEGDGIEGDESGSESENGDSKTQQEKRRA